MTIAVHLLTRLMWCSGVEFMYGKWVGPKGKMFALAFPELQKQLAITFKVSVMSYDILKEQPGLRPAPYLASRGMTWIQRVDQTSMDDVALKDYLRESHRLCAANLSKSEQVKLGFLRSDFQKVK